MKLTLANTLLLFVFLVSSGGSFAQDNFPPTAKRYFGQTPPNLVPKLFAPGIVATSEHRETEVLFLPDMSELSFTRSGGEHTEPKWIVMQFKNNTWSEKHIPPAQINQYKEKFSPSVSQINSLPQFKNVPIVGFTFAPSGTIYFYVLDFKDGSGHLSYSRFINGKYETPQKITQIDRGNYIAHPFIASDESYLMWDAEVNGKTKPDIFISFKQKDGSWGAPRDFGDAINTNAYEQRPKVTPDGKYLFFWRGDKKLKKDGSSYWIGNPHWVDAKIIETLKPKE
ncbi:hypothetical protein [Pseudoalteromonas sp. S16_S37]|uniref:hypothetical protein n=1 Tax=Pseudoalteromonas sp. S16_S37 TaxID=2720228 RepID=UPI0016818C2B|nr:hypothetical protein [Pseudoalteromonas sp. S16_S37]MBD1583683.1 hypothetical protein [Pseudoalteromonas sp. S16_S37]